jgi:hypothetical protein
MTFFSYIFSLFRWSSSSSPIQYDSSAVPLARLVLVPTLRFWISFPLWNSVLFILCWYYFPCYYLLSCFLFKVYISKKAVFYFTIITSSFVLSKCFFCVICFFFPCVFLISYLLHTFTFNFFCSVWTLLKINYQKVWQESFFYYY